MAVFAGSNGGDGSAAQPTFRPDSVLAKNPAVQASTALTGIALAPVGAIDDVFASVQTPFTALANTFGADVEPFELGLTAGLGANEEVERVARNTGGAVAGLGTGIFVTPNLLRKGTKLGDTVSSLALKAGVSPRRLARMQINDKRTERLKNSLYLRDRKAVGGVVGASVPPILRAEDTLLGGRLQAFKTYRTQAQLDITKDIVSGEVGMAVLANQNELLYNGFGFDDVLIGGAFAALGAPIGALQAGFVNRDALARATAEGAEIWRDVVTKAQSQGNLATTNPGFAQGQDAWTSALFNTLNAKRADEGLNAADDATRPNLDNVRQAAVTGLAENLETLGKSKPLQRRTETIKEATGSAAQPTEIQRRAAADTVFEFPQLTIGLTKVMPVQGIEETAEALNANIKAALKDPDKRHELEYWADHQMMLRESDGTVVPVEGLRDLDKDVSGAPRYLTGRRQEDFFDQNSTDVIVPRKGSTIPGERDVRLKDNQDFTAEVDGTILRKGKPITKDSLFKDVFTVTGIKALLEAADVNADTLKLPTQFTEVTPNDHWLKLSWISEKLEQGKLTTKETAGVNSQQLQGEILNQRVNNLRALVDGNITPTMLASDVSKVTGLPLHQRFGGDWTPAGEALTTLAAQTTGKITDIGDVNKIAEAAADVYADSYAPSVRQQLVDDVTQILESKPSFNTRTRQSVIKRGEDELAPPVVFVNRVTQGTPKEMSVQAEMLSNIAVKRRQAALVHPDGHWMVRAVAQNIDNNPIAAQGAAKVDELHTHSLKHNKGVAGVITTREHQASDSVTLQSAHIIATETERVFDRGITEVMQPVVDLANAAQRKGQEATLAQYASYKSAFTAGLTIKEAVQPGQVSLDLKNLQTRETIRRLLPNQFQRLMQSGDVKAFDVNRALLHGRYEPINFSEEASTLINAVNDLEYDRLRGANQLRMITNKPPVRERMGHLPPADFRDQQMKFFRNKSDGRISGFVAAKTTDELQRLVKNAQRADPSLVVADEITTQRYIEYFDDIYEGRMIDYRNPLAQTGRSKNLNLNTTIDVTGDVLRADLEAIRDGYRRVGTNTRKLRFEQAINYTKFAQEARGVNRSGSLKRDDQGKGPAYFSPEQEYNRIMEGDSSLPPEGIPQQLDNLLEAATPIIEPIIQVAAKSLGVLKETARLTKSQQEIAEDLFNNSHTNNLFASVEDAFQRAQVESPFAGADMQRRLQRLNKATSTALLRFLGFGHALLNVTSVAVTAPAVARRLARGADESEADFRARMGGIADYVDGNIATINPTKLMAKGMFAAYDNSPEMQKAMQAAADRGYLEAKVMEELQRTLYAKLPQTKLGEFMDQMLGTPSEKSPKGGILTRISDSSEVMARRISWGMGYKLSKTINANRALGDNDHYAFAHWFANQTIGNYDPKIKPDMYRGTVGIPAGLFQTFVVNYMQRITNMLEKKEYKNLFYQGVTQASMFGLSSLPGYEQLSSLIGGAKSDEPDLTDRLYQTYGKDVTDLVFAGTLSNLVKVFPGEQDGIAFHQRGGVTPSPQIPTIANATDFPAGSAIASVYQGINEFVAEGLASGRIPSRQRAAELVAMYAPVTGARSIAEGYLGYTVNRNNDVIMPDIYTVSGGLSLLLGGKTLEESRIGDAIYQNGGFNRSKNTRVKRIVNDAIARSRAAGEPMTEEEIQRLEDTLADYSAKPSRIVKNAQKKARISRANRDADKLDGQPNPTPYLRVRDRQQLPMFLEEVE